MNQIPEETPEEENWRFRRINGETADLFDEEPDDEQTVRRLSRKQLGNGNAR